MTEMPDFSKMTKEEIGDWFLSADTTGLLARAQRPTESMAQVDAQGDGIVRRALQEYRERHRDAAA